jgi:hypothetical protein
LAANSITHADLLLVARRLHGQSLATAGGLARFTVEVRRGRHGDAIYCTPASTGKSRRLGAGTDKALAHFNATGSRRISDYGLLTQNASYILALIDQLRVLRQRGSI